MYYLNEGPMSFGLHLFLAVMWLLLTLCVLGFGIYGLVKGIFILAITCGAIVAISTFLIINDYKSLFGSNNVSSPQK